MRRILILIATVTAVVMTAVAVFVLSTLPPRSLQSSFERNRAALSVGAWHVHSSRSDGSGSVEEIAAAAARAGLDFVVLMDHGDGTRAIDPPRYLNNVLIIDGVEINTDSGHVAVLDLKAPSAYPLAGDVRDVLEDVERLSGWAVAAHPDSPRPNLRWRGQAPVGVGGVEWLNVDSEWRSQSASTLAATALRSAVRGPEAIASLFRAPSPGLTRWDNMQRSRPVVGLASVDAHARLGADDASWGRAASLRFPSYDSMFRTVAQVVQLASPPTGAPAADGQAILDGLRQGRSYSAVRAFAEYFPTIEFSVATVSGKPVVMGGHVPSGQSGAVMAKIGAFAPRVDLLKDGRIVGSGRSVVELAGPAPPGAYRVEAYLPGHKLPWIVTNSIYVDPEPPAAGPGRPTSIAPAGLPVPPDSWHIEASETSRASIDARTTGNVAVSYRIGGGAPAGQYVALVTDASGNSALDRIAITASSETPMRLSLQVRVPGGRDGRRWRKSLYLDREPRTYVVSLSELEPVERGSMLRPIVARVQSVLLVIDTVNTLPGSSGVVHLNDVRLITAPPVEPPGR